MQRFPFLQGFHAGGPVHGIMLTLVIAFVVLFTRDRHASPGRDRRFSTALFAICIVAFLYYLRPSQLGWNHSLPLHVCDITGVVAAMAIRTGNRTARSVLHFWGLVLSSQALIFPAVEAGPAHCDFWLYWIDHGAIIAAAVYDIRVRRYRASWRDWRIAILLIAAYIMIITPFDQLMHVDYGFLGHTELSETSVGALGPWPVRIAVMWLLGVIGMVLLQTLLNLRFEGASPTAPIGDADRLTASARDHLAMRRAIRACSPTVVALS